jgi:aldehyde dehydrogenase (NAD+)
MQLPEAQLYIDGTLRPANGGTYDNIGPWTGEVVGKAADASADDVDASNRRGAPRFRRHRLVDQSRAALRTRAEIHANCCSGQLRDRLVRPRAASKPASRSARLSRAQVDGRSTAIAIGVLECFPQ